MPGASASWLARRPSEPVGKKAKKAARAAAKLASERRRGAV